jgi:hypothetical protein
MIQESSCIPRRQDILKKQRGKYFFTRTATKTFQLIAIFAGT